MTDHVPFADLSPNTYPSGWVPEIAHRTPPIVRLGVEALWTRPVDGQPIAVKVSHEFDSAPGRYAAYTGEGAVVHAEGTDLRPIAPRTDVACPYHVDDCDHAAHPCNHGVHPVADCAECTPPAPEMIGAPIPDGMYWGQVRAGSRTWRSWGYFEASDVIPWVERGAGVSTLSDGRTVITPGRFPDMRFVQDTDPLPPTPVEDESWPEGVTFGALTPAQQRAATRRAGEHLSAELTANADAIGAILDDES